MGNKMFAFAFSLRLASRLGYRMESIPVEAFSDSTSSIIQETNEKTVSNSSVEVVKDTDEPFEKIVERCAGKRVYVRGWFERAEFYTPIRNSLRGVFKINRIPSAYPVFHFRGEDFIAHGKELPVLYYIEAWQKLGSPKKVIICTDDINYPVIADFIRITRVDAVVAARDKMTDFALMVGAEELVISRSTFSWWAGFLSNSKVIQPLIDEPDASRNHKVGSWIGVNV